MALVAAEDLRWDFPTLLRGDGFLDLAVIGCTGGGQWVKINGLRLMLGAVATAAVVGAGAASWLIFGKSLPHASNDAAACAEKPRELRNLALSGKAGPMAGLMVDEVGAGRRPLIGDIPSPLIVNFWATWCAPCVREMPALARLNQALDGRIQVATLSEDRPRPGSEGGDVGGLIRRFYEINGIEGLPGLIDSDGSVARAFSVQGLPTTVLLDREGREIGRLVGPAEWDDPAVTDYLLACLPRTAGQ